MRISYAIVSLFCGILLLSACEKVINIDLNDSESKVVIEGIVTNENGQLVHTILVSKSCKFSSEGKNNPVNNATVVITDATSNITDTLVQTSPGNYNTSRILGIIGHNYQLVVIVDGQQYTANSTMPAQVMIDSLYIQELPVFGTNFKQVVPVFQDPFGTKNYYRFGVQVNDSVQRGVDAWDDLLSNGKLNSRPLQIENQDLLDGNDTVYVTMNNTDSATFAFFNTLYNASGNAQTPGNPLSNISGGALGYFSAMTIQKSYVLVP